MQVRKSNVHGYGTFASRRFAGGEVVVVWGGTVFTGGQIERGEARLLELGCVEVGETLICVAGAATHTPGGADMLKIHCFDGKNPYVNDA